MKFQNRLNSFAVIFSITVVAVLVYMNLRFDSVGSEPPVQEIVASGYEVGEERAISTLDPDFHSDASIQGRNEKEEKLSRSIERNHFSQEEIDLLESGEDQIRSGYFSEIMEDLFALDFVEDYLAEIKTAVAVKSHSASAGIAALAQDIYSDDWLPIFGELGLEDKTLFKVEAIITDDFSRRVELLNLWTDGEISRQQFVDAESEITPLNEKLERVLSASDFSAVMARRGEAVAAQGYSDEFIRMAEERRNGSLYPLIYSDDVASLSAYLEAGADPNASRRGDEDISLLSTAVITGSGEAAKILIRHGADVNFSNSHGQTVLHLAAARGDDDLVRYLLAQGANPAAKDRVGLTPAMSARIAGVGSNDGRFALVYQLLKASSE